MASAVTDRVFRVSTPDTIEPDLAALWRDLAQSGAPIARAVMSNLVVFRNRVAPQDAAVEVVTADLPLNEVVARHPSRLIVLEHEHGRIAPAAPFAAGVCIVTFGPPQARYGVEQIMVRSACADASLPSIVRRFIRGDLPTTVWWTEDLSQVAPLEPLVTMGRQLVYDSRKWRDVGKAVRALEPLITSRRVDLADVNWRRLAPVRRALDHMDRTRGTPFVEAGAQVRIAHGPGDAALAWLLAGSLLAARPDPAAEAPPVIEQTATGDAALVVTIRRASGEATVRLTPTRAIVADGAAVPLVVAVPIEAEAEAVAAELRMLSQDAALHAALSALVRLVATR
jgi:glucose-6-phosphate dehydrogenase assembly protein OpcA